LGLFFMSKIRRKYELVATAFDSKGRVLSTKFNDYTKSSPWQKMYAVMAGLSECKIYLHAEVSALLATRNHTGDSKVHSLLIQRFDSLGNPKLAKPCLGCMCAIRAFNVKILRYTTDIGIKEEVI
jgi:deoxycytidylate deaminase